MTIRAKNRAMVAGIIISAAALILSLLPMVASSDLDKVRDVRLVVRDMTYYLEGDPNPNPTLRFSAGERVRLVLTNEDAGMDHDFVVAGWDIKTKLLEGRGQDVVLIHVPVSRGSEAYHCSPHAGKMRGTITVE